MRKAKLEAICSPRLAWREAKRRLEGVLKGQVESKWRLEASLKRQAESKLCLQRDLERQVGPKRRSSWTWSAAWSAKLGPRGAQEARWRAVSRASPEASDVHIE